MDVLKSFGTAVARGSRRRLDGRRLHRQQAGDPPKAPCYVAQSKASRQDPSSLMHFAFSSYKVPPLFFRPSFLLDTTSCWKKTSNRTAARRQVTCCMQVSLLLSSDNPKHTELCTRHIVAFLCTEESYKKHAERSVRYVLSVTWSIVH